MNLRNAFFKAFFGALCLFTYVVQAQEGAAPLDVYKIEFAASGKKQLAAMVAYCHPEYLYATQTGDDRKKTSWLVWYQAEKLLKIDGKQGLPLDYRKQLKTNVYLTGAPIDTAIDNQLADNESSGKWDNENEYNMPGYGTLTFTKNTAAIYGYLCQKAIIQYHLDAQCKVGMIRKIEIWYCPELPPYYLPPFSFLQKIPGAALMISMQDTGGRTEYLRATRITKQQKDISFFKPSKDIRILYPPKLK